MTTQEPIFACQLQAIPVEHRATHQEDAAQVIAAVQETRELPTGYALRLPNDTALLQTIISFISYERLCCPFFRFALEIEPQQGPVWLHITGGTEDVKPFIQSEGFFQSTPGPSL